MLFFFHLLSFAFIFHAGKTKQVCTGEKKRTRQLTNQPSSLFSSIKGADTAVVRRSRREFPSILLGEHHRQSIELIINLCPPPPCTEDENPRRNRRTIAVVCSSLLGVR
ncbi:hypothetical protein GGS20DRAFT_551610 [Poronia punctata]|nr:hypothetical protein GGS20DRAFT_551610 [Poronia punctata]